ncbi:MAG: hypothetical protein NC924_04305 [Candidatus Omnitrophica bacterium]|nr:hypothetical protein [Candidatus Omnitrophota bacterium]
MRFILKILMSVGCLALVACASIPSINRLSVNMDKEEVRAILGNDFVARGGKIDKDGNTLEIWEYNEPRDKTTYQVYFLNNKVAQWGRPSDIANFPELFQPRSDLSQ